MTFDFTSGPIELKIMTYPHQTDDSILYYIQCKSYDIRLHKYDLYHPNEDPSLYVFYLGPMTWAQAFPVEEMHSAGPMFVTTSEMKNFDSDAPIKLFNSMTEYTQWITRWNMHYGIKYKLII